MLNFIERIICCYFFYILINIKNNVILHVLFQIINVYIAYKYILKNILIFNKKINIVYGLLQRIIFNVLK